MSDDASARLKLQLLRAGQSQKEMTHNEALTLLDIAAVPVAQAVLLDVPPSDPDPGDCWIVGAAPSGAWAGHARAIAGWSDGGWRFLDPIEGAAWWSVADHAEARYLGGTWVIGEIAATRLIVGGQQVIGGRRPAIADPSGGATADAEGRAAIASILGALRAHGLIAS